MFSSPHCKTIELRTDALGKMDKLNLLQLNHVKLKGSYKNFPQGLRWLCMHGFRLKYIPSELPMENLVALDMSYSDLKQLWKKPVVLGSLKILNLSYCRKLVRVDGFSGLPSLERLILEGCVSLNHVSESIGRCARLVIFDMSYCSKLIKLPRSIGKFKNVRILSINGCICIDEFPIEMKDMESLKELKADNIGLKSHASLSSFTKLIPGIPKLVSNSFPSSLIILSLKDNNLSNESFPIDFSSMLMLKELHLDKNPIDSLPTFVRSLSKLEVLSVKKCSMLKSLLCLPSKLEGLYVRKCSSLTKITFHEEMYPSPYIRSLGADSLNEISGIIKFQDLAQVDEEILSRLGWTNVACVKDQELYFSPPYIMFEDYKKKPVQMFYAFGIFSTYFLGKEVPNWSGGNKNSNGPSISYIMPPTPVNKKFQGFNIAYVYRYTRKMIMNGLRIYVANETKNLSWNYFPGVSVKGEGDEEIVWLSHWMFGNNEFEDGDEAFVKIHENENYGIMVKECVMSPMYSDISDMDEEEEDPLAYYKSWKQIIGGNLSYFEREGYYHLSHSDFFML